MRKKISGVDYFNLAATAKSARYAVDGLFPCPCCGSLEFSEAGGWEICQKCGWEDDPVQEEFPALLGGANGVSLNDARRNFSLTGNIEQTP